MPVVAVDSVWLLSALLFLDGATFSVATTPLVLLGAQRLPPWQVAVAGGAASAAGSAVQLLALRWMLAAPRPWMRRFLPARDRLDAALRRYPSASFLAIVVARATPMPDAPVKLAAAALGYPLPLYFLALLLGGIPYYAALALLGRAVRFPVWALAGIAGVFVLGLCVDLWRRARAYEEA
jgi:uncharacterized membrane protein YdjX (TVP38/TMEM64 family)